MTKLAILIALLVAATAAAQNGLDSRALSTERQLIETWQDALAKSKDWPDTKKLEELSLGLRNLGEWRTLPGHNELIDTIYRAIQHRILEIPNYPQYFTEKADRETEKIEAGKDFSRLDRVNAIGTFRDLPSPASIIALGEFLSDNRGVTSAGELSTAMLASHTIARIGLRDAPVPEREAFFSEEGVEKTRAWYEKVKAGEIAFSFKGEIEDYRLNTDGTWTSTPNLNRSVPSKNATTEPEPKLDPVASIPPARVEAVPETNHMAWWYGAVAILILAVGGLFLRPKKQAS